mmetsp:Transcript_32781/g.48099  ORF Transcript_32781/g.48099 Transcript_32781/m.48099 type:complete len:133 (-) Transcript_32781:189-587(-)|eukprot:CAMPEP_0195507986 /NCGR_PEP_ID=MMETSP0794_2-20130614/1313_1 /TAXON_ID=515487 /ORGANISM="Stephanopyxis turris, Strain CCMP 815" /LENGTH=132 /DNA_ID=CAMNT_0040634827 /DNA_START=81 /DNA_END=479 /DNA_ORIENTATION=+
MVLRFLVFLACLTLSHAAVFLSSGVDVETFVSQSIQENSVIVFSKSYCPYCKRTKSLLSQHATDTDVKFVELDLQNENDGALIQSQLLSVTGQRTVPNVFIHGRHIGGNSDLQELQKSGALLEVLQGREKDL